MSKEIRVELKLRNNLILTRMEEMGIRSVAELSRRAGIKGQYSVGKIIDMKESPLREKSDPLVLSWKPVVLAIARALFSEPEELFPEFLRRVQVDPRTKLHMEISTTDLKRLGGQIPRRFLLDDNPERDIQFREVEEALQKGIATLSPLEQRVIRLRFGLEDGLEHTLRWIGLELGFSAERIRQVVVRALRELQIVEQGVSILDSGLREYLHRNNE